MVLLLDGVIADITEGTEMTTSGGIEIGIVTGSIKGTMDSGVRETVCYSILTS